MGTRTTNYKLFKPALRDDADLTVLDGNWEQIDRLFKSLNDSVKEIDGFIRRTNWTGGFDKNKVIVSNSGGKLTASNVNAAQLTFLENLRENIQQQIDELSATFTASLAELNEELQTVKTSVSNGKSAVASAITDKGVSTSGSDTFATMAANIRLIETGIPNGREWIMMQNLPSDQYWGGIAYGAGRTVLLSGVGYSSDGDDNQISDVYCYSMDGATWTQGLMPSSQAWTNVVYGGGTFLAVAGYDDEGTFAGICATKRSTISWEQPWLQYSSLPTSIADSRIKIVYGNGKFVVGGNNTIAYSSSYGSSWTAYTLNLTSSNTTDERKEKISDIIFAEGWFFVLAQNGVLAYSRDAITWNYSAINYLSSAPETSTYEKLLYGKGVLVACGYKCHAYSEDEGQTWTLVDATNNYLVNGEEKEQPCYGNGVFVGSRGYSLDGKQVTNYDGTHPENIVYAEDKFVGTTYSYDDAHTTYWYSPTMVTNS